MSELALKHGLSFSDLYERDGLIRLDRAFVAHLAAAEATLHDRLMAARAAPDALDRKAESDLLVDLSPHLEDFVGGLFGIGKEVRALQAAHDRLAPLFSVKRLFVQRRAVKEVKEADAPQLNGHKLAQELDTLLGGAPVDFATREGVLAWELHYAEGVARWLDDEAAHKIPLKAALEYAGRALSAAPDELKPYPLAALGWVHYKRQEFDRAIDCLRKSSERAAQPVTFHHLGMAYLAAGRAEEAKAAFAKAKTVSRGLSLEDRMMQQVRSNIRLVEKVGGKKKAETAGVEKEK